MLKWLNFTSTAIQNFPMGDAHVREFPVYLPPQYQANRKTPYPVIFILAAFGSRGEKYIGSDSVFDLSLPQQLDREITAGTLPAVIVIFPDGGSKLGCSQYINSPALGNYMDYIADELVNLIDQEFHTYASEDYRGVLGHSSGGFGALMMGMLRPDRFRYICSSAGDSFYEFSLLQGVNDTIQMLEKHNGVENFLNWFFALPHSSLAGAKAFHTLLVLGMAPCYAPNLQNPPLYGDLFFDLHTGKIIDEIWQRYLQWDPVRLVDHQVDNLKKLAWLHLTAPSEDEYGLQLGHRQLAAKLAAHNIRYSLNEYSGRHGGNNWRFLSHLKLMLEQMKCFDG
ncbi:MAG: hypothetical protein KIT27_04710 [Legionellales bacterium]|nr:hypothetical protein [Legionellales bacterium]